MSHGKAMLLSCLIIFSTILAFTLFVNLVLKVPPPQNLIINMPFGGLLGWHLIPLARKLEGKKV